MKRIPTFRQWFASQGGEIETITQEDYDYYYPRYIKLFKLDVKGLL